MTVRTMPNSEASTSIAIRYLLTTSLHSLATVVATETVIPHPGADSSKLGAEIIAAIAVGPVFVVAIMGVILLICLCVLCRKRRSRRNSKMPNGGSTMFYLGKYYCHVYIYIYIYIFHDHTLFNKL